MGFSGEEKAKLLLLARKAIGQFLKTGEAPEVVKEVDAAEFSEPRGVFVTLRRGGELRGCIGFPFPTLPLGRAIIQAAVAAAASDFRFQPVSLEELKDITIEISVLTVPEKIEAEKPEGYPRKVKIGEDGLIIEYMGHSGLLLPQVPVEEGWGAEAFLDHLCMKAGLPAGTWKNEGVAIMAFQAEVMSEGK